MTKRPDDAIRHGWYRRTQPSNEQHNRHQAWPLSGVTPDPPPGLLRRHGAKISPAIDGASAGSTVYRTEVLLAPSQLLEAQPGLLDSMPGALDGVLNVHLAQAGWYVESEQPAGAQIVTRLRVRPRPAPHGNPGEWHAKSPDAYQALRLLRQATAGGPDAAAVAQISLDHLLFAISTIDGLPITEGHGNPARLPVAVLTSPPRRRPLAEVPGGRRPVVAVLDTGIGAHSWLDPAGDPQDRFWVDAAAAPISWQPPWEDLVGPGPEGDGISETLVGTLDSHAGHGTFIAGLIRQLAPDASVLSLHIMYSDGVIHESDAINALGWLHERVSHGGAAEFIDVVCLAFGYYEETPADEAVTSAFANVLAALGNRGIRVVAAGGNHATARETFPAALATALDPPEIPLVSIGALNPNKTKAHFSNEAPWITDWEVGTALMSTMPPFDGSLAPEYCIPPATPNGKVRESLDPDNFKGGFAIWSGTSFAAAAFAAKLAQALVTRLEGTSDHTSLRTVTPSAAIQRARETLTSCRPPAS